MLPDSKIHPDSGIHPHLDPHGNSFGCFRNQINPNSGFIRVPASSGFQVHPQSGFIRIPGMGTGPVRHIQIDFSVE